MFGFDCGFWHHYLTGSSLAAPLGPLAGILFSQDFPVYLSSIKKIIILCWKEPNCLPSDI